MDFRGLALPLQEGDVAEVARVLGVEEAHVRGVMDLESAGSGFLNDGRPKILFEAHWFSRFTDRRYDASHPRVSSRRWNRKLYKGGAAEYGRLEEAYELDADAALQSASWGLLQVMAFNHRECGYSTPAAFVQAMKVSEMNHLMVFAAFLRSKKLVEPLRRDDWRAFAAGYNGKGYEQNRYHTKLQRAVEKWRGVLGERPTAPVKPATPPVTEPAAPVFVDTPRKGFLAWLWGRVFG